MRIFVNEDLQIATKARILLNGKDISSRCYGADSYLGEAYCYRVNGDGLFFTEPIRPGAQPSSEVEVARETLYGKVEIILPLRLRILFYLKTFFNGMGNHFKWV